MDKNTFIPHINHPDCRKLYQEYIGKKLSHLNFETDINKEIEKVPYFYYSKNGGESFGPKITYEYAWFTPWGIIPPAVFPPSQEGKLWHRNVILSYIKTRKTHALSELKSKIKFPKCTLRNHPCLNKCQFSVLIPLDKYYYCAYTIENNCLYFRFENPKYNPKFIIEIVDSIPNVCSFKMSIKAKYESKGINISVEPHQISGWSWYPRLESLIRAGI